MKTASQWAEILVNCGVKPATAVKWSASFESQVLESSFSLGAEEVPHFLANICHESGMLERLEENLNYSAEALISKFGRHRINEADARKYGRTPEHAANQPMIANCLYGGAWGAENLGNTETGDGWRFRGRGLIQATGRANYRLLSDAMGQDLEANPDLLAQPSFALESALLWWERRVPDAVMGDIPRTRAKVNGGDLGLAHVTELTGKLQEQLA